MINILEKQCFLIIWKSKITNVDLQLQIGVLFWMQELTNVDFRIQRGFYVAVCGTKK